MVPFLYLRRILELARYTHKHFLIPLMVGLCQSVAITNISSTLHWPGGIKRSVRLWILYGALKIITTITQLEILQRASRSIKTLLKSLVDSMLAFKPKV